MKYDSRGREAHGHYDNADAGPVKYDSYGRDAYVHYDNHRSGKQESQVFGHRKHKINR